MQKFEQDAQYSGNQFLVLLKLRPRMAERLFNDHHCLEGIDYRFELQRHHQLKLRQGGGVTAVSYTHLTLPTTPYV